MKRLVLALALLSSGLALPAFGQTTSGVSANTEAKQNKIALNDEQKQTIIQAAVAAGARQKTPKEFSPALGAKVPKEVYLHGFIPAVTQKTPELKEYMYAYLDQAVVLVEGPENKVVAVVDLPDNLVVGGQPHQGAAEASSTQPKGAGASTTGSVPSHTSPETIK